MLNHEKKMNCNRFLLRLSSLLSLEFQAIFYLVCIVTSLYCPTNSLIHVHTSAGSTNQYSNDVMHKDAARDMWRMTSLTSSVETLGTFFLNLFNAELGVNETKHLFGSTSFEVKTRDGLEDLAKALGKNFSIQLEGYVDSVERLADSVKLFALSNDTLLLPKCCDLDAGSLLYDVEYKSEVRRDMACWYTVSKSKSNFFVPAIFSQVMIKNSVKEPSLRWQYFVSPDGIYVEYPSNLQNCHANSAAPDGPRSVLMPKTHRERKMWLIQKSKTDSRVHRLLFLIQLGRSPSQEGISATKDIIRMLLRFMDEANEVGVMDIDPEDVSSYFVCGQPMPVTPWTRNQILSYLDNVEQRYKAPKGVEVEFDEEEYDALWPLNRSLQIACANFSGQLPFPPSAVTIIHISHELQFNKSSNPFSINSPCPVFIESYFLGKTEKNVEMSYKTRLQRSSSKNIWNVQVQFADQMGPEEFAIKVALKLNTKKELWSLSDVLNQFFPEDVKNSSSVEFSVPHWNPVSKEPVIVAKKYVAFNGIVVGLVAAEIPVTHFTQQILYYVNENQCDAKSYVFLIDINGRVIAHPAFGKADTSYEALSPIQIEQMEVRPGFDSLEKRLTDELSGCQSLQQPNRSSWVSYAWARVQNYVVVLVTFDDGVGCFPYREEMVLKKAWLSPKADIQHHLLLEQEQCCGNGAVNYKKASLYLSPSAFSNPLTTFTHAAKHSMAVMAFLSDSSGLLRNQNKGLKSSVKSNIGVISNVLPIWKFQSETSAWRKYIQRRFAAAGGGTFLLIHPGIKVRTDYTPHSSAWFRSSIRGDGKLMFSPPMLNAAGTPISSITAVVKSSGSFRAIPVAILGATVSIGFFEKVLTDMVPECAFAKNQEWKLKKQNIRCVLFDEHGVTVYHPRLASLLTSTSSVIHLTQIEPLCAIDILQYGTNTTALPLRKQTCHKLSAISATQGSLQRYYTFSIPAAGIQKVKPGELCYHYQIVPIPNTNLFLANIQDSCTSPAAFCPCSTVNNLCLNCLRIEMSDCECPCECPQAPKSCTTKNLMEFKPDTEPCEFPGDPISFDGAPCANSSLSCDVLTPCADILEEGNCVGIGDCTWCETANRKQCVTFAQCYGFLRNPNGEYLGDALQPDESNAITTEAAKQSNESLSILPILAVLAVFLIFPVLVFCCYRQRALQSSFSQPDVSLLPLQESPMGSIIPQVASSPSNSDSDGEVLPVPAIYIRRQLRRGRSLPVPPPRSPLGSVFTESDHGYSTMTQNEDSSEAGGKTRPVTSSSLSKTLHAIPTSTRVHHPEDSSISVCHDVMSAHHASEEAMAG